MGALQDDLDGFVDHAVEVVGVAVVACVFLPLRFLIGVDHFEENFVELFLLKREGADSSGAGVGDVKGVAAIFGGQDGERREHGFEEGGSGVFAASGVDQQVRAAVEGGDVLAGSGEEDALSDAELAGEAAIMIFLSLSDDDE